MSSVDRDIVRGIEENLWATWSNFGRGDGCTLHEEDHVLWFETPIPRLPYNTVLRFDAEADVERRVDAIFERCAERGVPLMWIVHPSARPDDLGDRLRQRGLEEVEVCPGMSMDLAAPPAEDPVPEDIDIHEVTSKSDLNDMFELVAWRWEVPRRVTSMLPRVLRAFNIGKPGSGHRLWIARQGGVPVSKVAMSLGAGVAGIYGVVTKPEARGLGLARTLTLRALHEARAAGYERAILHSTPMALSLYEKIGFRTYAQFRVFAPPDALHL